MIEHNENIVIVCGMAHSGTTIVTHILRQNPNLNLCVSGHMVHILENDFLRHADTEAIKKLLTNKKRILLKKPWVECDHKDWLIQNMPNAYYIYCTKNREKLIDRWGRPDSFVLPSFRKTSRKEKENRYDECYANALELQSKLKRFMVIENKTLIENPASTFKNINNFLDLEHFNYDVSEVSATNSIKTKINKKLKML